MGSGQFNQRLEAFIFVVQKARRALQASNLFTK